MNVRAAVLTLLFVAGWVLLLVLPLVALSAAASSGIVQAVTRVRAAAPAAARGILCVEGLVAEPVLARRVRADLARVLKLAPPATNPRACACVREADGAFLGVLRVFNRQGHYLLRASGASAAAVATRFSAALDGFRDAFPARPGVRRVACPECDPARCPLRRLKRVPAPAAA